jgi:alanine dehydrogenase
MDIGVPKETQRDEHRVAVTPLGARRLVEHGHRVFIESGAGEGARYGDKDYREAGAEVAYRVEEVLLRAEMVLAVGGPTTEQVDLLRPGQAILGFLHLAVSPRDTVRKLIERKITAIGYEIVEDDEGILPVLHSIGELAGQMVVHTAAHLLMTESGGRGMLLGAVPGVAPARVLILGAGTVGCTAAHTALNAGSQVTILDSDMAKLHRVAEAFENRVVAMLADRETVARYAEEADVVIGAVLVPGGPAPWLVTRDMVARMKPGSVIIDVSIDQGGCVETSRPTKLGDPTFVVHDVVHYCVPNMTANVARMASKVLNNAQLPFAIELANQGVDAALKISRPLSRGTYLQHGEIRKQVLAGLLGSADR